MQKTGKRRDSTRKKKQFMIYKDSVSTWTWKVMNIKAQGLTCIKLQQVCRMQQYDSVRSTTSLYQGQMDYPCTHSVELLDKSVSKGLLSHSTLYRSFRGQFLQARWPNQQRQSTKGRWNQASITLGPFHTSKHSILLLLLLLLLF